MRSQLQKYILECAKPLKPTPYFKSRNILNQSIKNKNGRRFYSVQLRLELFQAFDVYRVRLTRQLDRALVTATLSKMLPGVQCIVLGNKNKATNSRVIDIPSAGFAVLLRRHIREMPDKLHLTTALPEYNAQRHQCLFYAQLATVTKCPFDSPEKFSTMNF